MLASAKKHGADVDAPGWPFDTTPLPAAAWAGQTEAVKTLLAHHPNVNTTNDQGETPLHVAVR